MEETNYVREQVVDPTVANVRLGSSHDSSTVEDNEKGIPVSKEPSPTLEVGAVYAKKSYIKKLSLLGPKQEQNTMFRQIWQSLYYLSWPVIFYSGYTLLFYTFMSLQVTNSRQVSHMDPILFYSIF
jgi:hypothetical protein